MRRPSAMRSSQTRQPPAIRRGSRYPWFFEYFGLVAVGINLERMFASDNESKLDQGWIGSGCVGLTSPPDPLASSPGGPQMHALQMQSAHSHEEAEIHNHLTTQQAITLSLHQLRSSWSSSESVSLA